jgi:hypothetical protein
MIRSDSSVAYLLQTEAAVGDNDLTRPLGVRAHQPGNDGARSSRRAAARRALTAARSSYQAKSVASGVDGSAHSVHPDAGVGLTPDSEPRLSAPCTARVRSPALRVHSEAREGDHARALDKSGLGPANQIDRL